MGAGFVGAILALAIGKYDSLPVITVSRQLPTRTIPHRTGIRPDKWFDCLVVVLEGSSPRDSDPSGQKLGFIFTGGGCPRTCYH